MTFTPRAAVSLAIALFSATFLVLAFGYSEKARLLPVMVTSGVLFMALIQLAGDLFPTIRARMTFLDQQSLLANDKTINVSEDVRKLLDDGQDPNTPVEPTIGPEPEAGPGDSWQLIAVCVLAMAGLLVLLQLVPYWIAVPVFLFVMLGVIGRQKPVVSLVIAAVTGLVLFGLFDLILNARI